MRRQRSGKGGCSMKNYDFHHLLEPVEFQEFARDIIQVREKDTPGSVPGRAGSGDGRPMHHA